MSELPGSETVSIVDLGEGFQGLVRRASGELRWIPGAWVPGEVLEIAFASSPKAPPVWVRVLGTAPERITPACHHAGLCGGCDRMHITEQMQRALKEKRVRDVLVRIGGLTEPPVQPLVHRGASLGYRNKLSLHPCFEENSLRFGLHKANDVQGIYPLDRCLLAPPWMIEWAETFARLADARPAWRKAIHSLVLRQGADPESRAAIITLRDVLPPENDALAWLEDSSLPACEGLLLVCLPTASGSRKKKLPTTRLVRGSGVLSELAGDDRIDVPYECFHQINPVAAHELARLVCEALEPAPGISIADFYGGCGFFSIPLARAGADVVCFEADTAAVQSACRSATRLGISTFSGTAHDLRTPLTGKASFDRAVVDPPRSGLSPALLEALIHHPLQRIAYVSCDPATLARDLKVLCTNGPYRLISVQPVDLFPQTRHIECVAIMQRQM